MPKASSIPSILALSNSPPRSVWKTWMSEKGGLGRRERGPHQVGVLARPRRMPDDLAVRQVGRQADVAPAAADAHAGEVDAHVGARLAPAELPGRRIGQVGFVGPAGMAFELLASVRAGQAVFPHYPADSPAAGRYAAAGDQGAQQQSIDASASGDATGAAKGAARQDANTLDGIIAGIEADFESTEADIAAQLEDVKSKAGGSYADYSANKDLLANWFTNTQEKSSALFTRTSDNAKKYYTLLAQQAPSMSSGDIDDAMKAFYRAVYDDAYKEMYRSVYTDAYKDVYRMFYSGVMKDAYDVKPYSEASDEQSDLYRTMSDAQSDFYQAMSDAQSDLYTMHSDVYGELYDKNYDLSKVLD